jgi:hypothetical protein
MKLSFSSEPIGHFFVPKNLNLKTGHLKIFWQFYYPIPIWQCMYKIAITYIIRYYVYMLQL